MKKSSYANLTSHDDFNYRRLKLVNPPEISDANAPFYLVGSEVYNPGKESIILVNEILRMNFLAAKYIQKMDGHLGRKYIEVKPESHEYMSHCFYLTYTVSGAPCTLVKIYGKEKFKGHKEQSALEPFKRSF